MEKRGQVTLFIILGIVILILIGLYIVFLGEQTPTFETRTEDFINMRVFVESGLKTYSEEAIVKIGEQGGYINSLDFLTDDYKEEYSNIETAVGIESIYMSSLEYGFPYVDGHQLALSVPDYPWPELSSDSSSSHYSSTYKLGIPIIPQLEQSSARNATTVKREMEEYIEEGIAGLNVIEHFEHQFDIKIESEPDVKVTFGEGKTLVELEYPINMTHRGTDGFKRMESYAIDLPIDFRTFYTFIEEALYYETSQIDFEIIDPNQFRNLPASKDEFWVSLIDLDEELDLIIFRYNQTHDDEIIFRTVRQNRIPAMYDLEPKTYTKVIDGVEQQIDYEIDEGIDLNYHEHNDSTEGFVVYQDSILEYILEPGVEVPRQAIDPDEFDELTFTYGKSSDCPSYDNITFSVIENTGDFSIEYPKHHINLVNYTCETRVFVSDQADGYDKDYESVYFQHTGRECIDHECGICKECCWDGCCMDYMCHDPGAGRCTDPDIINKPDLNSVERGDSDYSMDSTAVQDVNFLEFGDVTEYQWECHNWVTYCSNCNGTCTSIDSEGYCQSCEHNCLSTDEYCGEPKDCCEYCADPCEGTCTSYSSP